MQNKNKFFNKLKNNKLFRTLFAPLIYLKRKAIRTLPRIKPQWYVKYAYHSYTGSKLDLKKPKNIYEKINYIRYYGNTRYWSILTDKYKVREYIVKNGFADILNELYFVYDKPKDIKFDLLPNSFVLKTNNSCETNYLIKDKTTINEKKVRLTLKKWLTYDFGKNTGQPHYSKITPKIIAEKYLVNDDKRTDSLVDYKFYCFHGEVHYIFVYSDRIINTHNVKRMIYDKDWNKLVDKMDPKFEQIRTDLKPKSFIYMKKIAEKLSSSFPFVRVDFYEVNSNPVFGEMTFTPGYDSGATEEFMFEMGELIKIEE